MKKYILVFGLIVGTVTTYAIDNIKATIDLVNVKDDKVKVTLDPDKFKTDEVTFYVPQIIPGTYQNSNFGKFIHDFKALDKRGNELEFYKEGENIWKIKNGKKLDKVSYWVEDTFDSENASGIYPMEGTSTIAGETFLLNLHGFIGYFNGNQEVEYKITVDSPADLKPNTTLTNVSSSATKDVFEATRYFQVIDNPILYTKSESIGFNLDDIRVNLSVYSPTGKYSPADFEEALKKMMVAQKAFLGNANSTKQYDILLYLCTPEEIANFGGVYGALEHHTSTVVAFPESYSKEQMIEGLVDTVSHEFFHTLTPLNVHSEEIHYFDYNDPKLSQHLWMYEGVTEYFANLFQVNQGLIDENDFLERMKQKISVANRFNDTMSFTEMSANIVDEPYAEQYSNVYMKGALINMCLDILIREKSDGEKGILWVMQQLADKYGVDKPFKDDELIGEIVKLTYPEVEDFIANHIVGTTPINYNEYFAKVGAGSSAKETALESIFLTGAAPFFTPDVVNQVVKVTSLNNSLEELGLKVGDSILAINEVDLNDVFSNPDKQQQIQNEFIASTKWQPEQEISIKVNRNSEELLLKGKVGEPKAMVEDLGFIENANPQQIKLREAWLKG